MSATNLFDGPGARLTARIMARRNLDAEREAIEILEPGRTDRVVAIGAGAGAGVALMVQRVAWVLAVDPSQVMVEEITARNESAVAAGVVRVDRSTAARIDVPDGSIDGAVAVNSIQIWEPLDASLAEVARVLRPGARLVSLTHDWAIERSTRRDVPDWLRWIEDLARPNGLVGMRSWRARAERGRSVVMELTKATS